MLGLSSRLSVYSFPSLLLKSFHYQPRTRVFKRNHLKRTFTNKTYDNQPKLPPLPVPPLNLTLEKYIKTLKPVLEPEDWNRSKTIVEEFGKSPIAEKLQKKLQQRAEEKTKVNESWLEEWWLQYAYHIWKEPLPIHSNFWLHFDRDIVKEGISWAVNGSRVIHKILEVKKMLENQEIPLEYMKDKPLCMNQYLPIFSCTRIPGEERDHLDIRTPQPHLVVISNKQFYELKLEHEGHELSVHELQLQLMAIASSSQNSPPALSPGIFTSWFRDKYAKVQQELIQNPVNKETIEKIRSSAFVVCLDSEEPSDIQSASLCCAAGDASNRWFDKIFQLIIFKNGRIGANVEHSPFDAPAFCTIIQRALAMVRDQYQKGFPILETPRDLPAPSKLSWHLSPQVIQAAQTAEKDFRTLVSDVDLHVVHFDLFGSRFLKKKKLSPDGFVQMALQLAYYKVHGKGCPTYESAQTRQFLHGRTSTVRSFSEESVAFVKGMSSDIDKNAKIGLLHNAIQSHRDYLLDCTNGKDVDRHLLGLRILAMQEGLDLPIFQDKAFAASSRYLLSTSNVPAFDFTGGFGNMYPEGYGIPYAIREDNIISNIVSRVSCPETSSKRFGEAFEKSLKEMAALFEPFPIDKL